MDGMIDPAALWPTMTAAAHSCGIAATAAVMTAYG
jgi:hypothetical protein